MALSSPLVSMPMSFVIYVRQAQSLNQIAGTNTLPSENAIAMMRVQGQKQHKEWPKKWNGECARIASGIRDPEEKEKDR